VRRKDAGARLLGRRDVLKLGVGVAGAAALDLALPRAAGASGPPPTSIAFKPFTQELPLPPTLAPVGPFPTNQPVDPARARFYVVHMRKAPAEILPGVQTEIWGYEGQYPGPTIRGRTRTADLVRHVNELDVEGSIHQHGGHNPSDSDGFPNLFVMPGTSRDYFYPNESAGGDPNENPSTLWYHDHAMDITGPNVYRGLAAFYLMTDDLEDELVASRRLPAASFDVPLVLQDRRFNPDGSLFYNPFEHDGFLGDVFVANGKAQPFFRVQRRKYRFRILCGSNARVYLLRLSTGAPFLQIGADSWLLPFAIQRDRMLLGMAERVDVVVDFRDAPDEVFLENIVVQNDGRGPGGDLSNPAVQVPGTPLVKFVVEGAPVPNDVTIAPGDPVRPHTAILPREIVTTRTFEFNRSSGAWQINGRFFDPGRVDASPALGSAERWILKNGGGGWWHPIHVHLEAHQLMSFNGQPPPVYNSFKKDTTLLGPGDVAEVFIRFRDHSGPIVFHCHNLEHEDMRMMGVFDAR
jgi:FtsP/CotA-like multicopper oxidase with cupredoxin domain